MTVNIALTVHDKINLQNATDLAAYYMAQRQSEILNAIAHQNYQIRQSWKLLSFRYRTLGTLGLNNHPLKDSSPPQEAPFSTFPSICIGNPHWSLTEEAGANSENICQEINFSLPTLPKTVIVAPLTYFSSHVSSNAAYRRNYGSACKKISAMNWYYSMKIATAFRFDQQNRRALIYSLAQNLSQQNFIELDGAPVYIGVEKTFLKNLTEKNRESYERGDLKIEILNSLQGSNPLQWLPSIDIYPQIAYSFLRKKGGGGGTGCDTELLYTSSPIGRSTIETHLRDVGVDRNEWNMILQLSNSYGKTQETSSSFFPHGGFDPSLHFLNYTIGVEKNPWYMAYTGVRVSISTQPIFSPLSSLQLNARSFAKPFGGRIGPWAKRLWSPTATESTGEPVDSTFKVRFPPEEEPNTQDKEIMQKFLPNYARYPGDELGLRSLTALKAITIEQVLTFPSFHEINRAFENDDSNDILSFSLTDQEEVLSRKYEIATLAPDLFDITYYSVFANYGQSYLQKIINLKEKNLVIPSNLPLRGDLSSRSVTFKDVKSVKDQLTENFHIFREQAITQDNSQNYFIKPEQLNLLLTGWTASEFLDYSATPSHNFASCRPEDGWDIQQQDGSWVLKHEKPDLTLASSCIKGGRTGYSVKWVSRNFLESSQHSPTPEGPSGALRNPPSTLGW